MHLNNSNGYWYLRRHTDDGKETIAKLGKHEDRPAIYRPELYQDKAENILTRLPAESVDCIVTDPPYGIEYESSWTEHDGAHTLGGIFNDSSLDFLEELASEFRRVLKPDSHAYVFTRWDQYPEMAPYFTKDLDLNTVIVWNKKSQGMGDLSTWGPTHEFVMHFEKGSPELFGGRPKNIIHCPSIEITPETQVHPTQKPRPVMEQLIEKSTRPGDVVFDPFGGSYAVPRASMRLFRRSISCELDPETHRAGAGFVEKQLQQDPVYNIDWTGVSNLRVEDTNIVKSIEADDKAIIEA